MNLNPQAKSILGILIVCSVSGLISGSMVTQDFRSDFLNFGWGSQVGPGIAFGLLFSITSIGTYLRNKDHKTFGPIAFIFLFTIASTIIYFITFQIAMWTIIFLDKSDSNGFVAGGLAGLFGAGVLAITAKFLSETRINFRDEILTTAVGTVAGIFFFSLLPGGSLSEVNWSLPFVIWQVAVGWSLSRSIQKGITDPINLTKNMLQSHNGETA
jgi:hypothetical protein